MTTAILMNDPKLGEIKVKVMTSIVKRAKAELVELVMYQCDDDWLPQSLISTAYQEGTEEEHHIDIRKVAFKKGQLVQEESTDVHLNPDYNEADHRLPESSEGPKG